MEESVEVKGAEYTSGQVIEVYQGSCKESFRQRDSDIHRYTLGCGGIYVCISGRVYCTQSSVGG